MTIKEYQQQTPRTTAIVPDQYEDMTAIHMVMGMATEVGELTDFFKKNLAYKKPIDMARVHDEVGDLMWYISEFCNYYHINLENILQKNIDKLRVRFPEKFDEQLAINKNDALEKTVFIEG